MRQPARYIGLTHGSKRVVNLLMYLDADLTKAFPAFRQFLECIPAELPLGEARLFCTEQLLLESDAQLTQIEAKFRPLVLRECRAVIKALAGS